MIKDKNLVDVIKKYYQITFKVTLVMHLTLLKHSFVQKIEN